MLDKGEQKTKWCQNEKYTTTFFVEATKNKELARECQRILDDASLGIKVIEKTGESIKSKLVKYKPFKKKLRKRNLFIVFFWTKHQLQKQRDHIRNML